MSRVEDGLRVTEEEASETGVKGELKEGRGGHLLELHFTIKRDI